MGGRLSQVIPFSNPHIPSSFSPLCLCTWYSLPSMHSLFLIWVTCLFFEIPLQNPTLQRALPDFT